MKIVVPINYTSILGTNIINSLNISLIITHDCQPSDTFFLTSTKNFGKFEQ